MALITCYPTSTETFKSKHKHVWREDQFDGGGRYKWTVAKKGDYIHTSTRDIWLVPGEEVRCVEGSGFFRNPDYRHGNAPRVEL